MVSLRSGLEDLMFDSPFDFFSLLIAIVAFIFARKAFNQMAALRARLDLMETLASSAAAARPAPLRAHEGPIAPSASDKIRIETTEEESPPIQPAAPPPIPRIPAAAPASQPGPGFASAPAGWSGSAA